MNSRMTGGISAALLAGILAAAVSTTPAAAQVRGGFAAARAGRVGPVSGFRIGQRGSFHQHPRPRSFAPFPYYYAPYWWDYWDYDDGYDYESEPPAAGAPASPLVVVQSAQPAAAPTPSAPEPLLLKLRGDQWVRVTVSAESANQEQAAVHASAAGPVAMPMGPEAAKPPAEVSPVVLVFRDGHQEQVESYMIFGHVLYIKADYWTTGSWTRQIQIAQLDLPATLKLNHERGVKFSLPSGPDEVILR